MFYQLGETTDATTIFSKTINDNRGKQWGIIVEKVYYPNRKKKLEKERIHRWLEASVCNQVDTHQSNFDMSTLESCLSVSVLL